MCVVGGGGGGHWDGGFAGHISPYISIYMKNLEILLIRNQWTDYSTIWQKCFFSDTVSSCHDSSEKRTGILSIYVYEKKKKKKRSSCQKPLERFQLGKNVALMTFQKDCSSHHES